MDLQLQVQVRYSSRYIYIFFIIFHLVPRRYFTSLKKQRWYARIVVFGARSSLPTFAPQREDIDRSFTNWASNFGICNHSSTSHWACRTYRAARARLAARMRTTRCRCASTTAVWTYRSCVTSAAYFAFATITCTRYGVLLFVIKCWSTTSSYKYMAFAWPSLRWLPLCIQSMRISYCRLQKCTVRCLH